MVNIFALLLGCQLIGEVISRFLKLPIPGPVLGMVILFIGLMIRGKVPYELSTVSGGLLQHLSLLFVPAGVGIMLHASLLAKYWQALIVALLVSTVVTIVVTGFLMSRLTKSADPGAEEMEQ